MSERRPLVGGNWKMNTTPRTAEGLAAAVVADHRDAEACEVCLFPPYPFLAAVERICRESTVAVGGQDVSAHPEGAFTGQVSAGMLLQTGCSWTLVGHSERRHGLGESDTLLNAKVKMVFKQNGHLTLTRENGENVTLKEKEERLGGGR